MYAKQLLRPCYPCYGKFREVNARGFSRASISVFGAALLSLTTPSSQADTALNTFDANLGTWTTESGNHADGNDFGWRNSGNASGTVGEVGGTIARLNPGAAGALGMPRILDTTSFVGQPLNLNQALSISGKMWLQDPGTAVTTLHLGYYNSADPTGQRFVLRINEPSTAGTGIWRFRFGVNGASGTRISAPDNTWDSASLDFNLLWTPSGLNDGSGAAAGTVSLGLSSITVPAFAVTANTAAFDSFGIWVDSTSNPSDPLAIQTMFFDNIQYTITTVPEPSVVWLLISGMGALVLTKRIRTVRR